MDTFSSATTKEKQKQKIKEFIFPRLSLFLASSGGAPVCARFWSLLFGRAFSTPFSEPQGFLKADAREKREDETEKNKIHNLDSK